MPSVGFKLFVSNPDETVYPTGAPFLPSFKLESFESVCGSTSAVISYTLNRAGTSQLILDFDHNGQYDAGGRDLVLKQEGVPGINTISWDRKDGLGQPVSDEDLVSIRIISNFGLGIHHLGLEDIEYLHNGFKMTQVRPLFQTQPEDRFYWDDRIIATSTPGLQTPYSSGTQPPAINLLGLPERKWDNFTSNSVIGFGNKNTINTWWSMYDLDTTGWFKITSCDFDISGTVIMDIYGVNGLKGTSGPTLDGEGTNAGGLNAILISMNSGRVKAISPVATNGNFTFTGVSPDAYKVVISTTMASPGDSAVGVTLPAGWLNTGAKDGSGAPAGTQDGVLNLALRTPHSRISYSASSVLRQAKRRKWPLPRLK